MNWLSVVRYFTIEKMFQHLRSFLYVKYIFLLPILFSYHNNISYHYDKISDFNKSESYPHWYGGRILPIQCDSYVFSQKLTTSHNLTLTNISDMVDESYLYAFQSENTNTDVRNILMMTRKLCLLVRFGLLTNPTISACSGPRGHTCGTNTRCSQR